MALIPITPPVSGQMYPQKGVVQFSWQGFANAGDTGDPASIPRFQQRTVQATGAFGGALSINMEGSNDGGTTWFLLTDDNGAALTFAAPGLRGINDAVNPLLIRPNATAGAAGVANIFVAGVAVAS